MPNLTTREHLHTYRIEFACTMPKLNAANEGMVAYGTKRGKGTSFRFGGGLPGKTLIVTDNQSTTTTAKTCTFTRSNFADPERPLLAEIVTAINAAFTEAACVVASSGAYGELILTAPAAANGNILTIGAGTANEFLGFPSMGMSIVNDTGVLITLPAEMGFPDTSLLYELVPEVDLYALTPATGVLTKLFGPAGMAAPIWTPANRTIDMRDGSKDAAGVVHGVITF